MPYENWAIKDFSAGYIDAVDDNLLPDNAASDCSNVISRISGILRGRPGQVRLNDTPLGGSVQGLFSYYYGDPVQRKLVAAYNGTIGYWNDEEFVPIKDGQDTSAPVFFEACVNYMVCFNGKDAPWKWDGETVSDLQNAPEDGQFPVLHKDKLFVVSKSDPSVLRWSNSFQPEQWPAVNYFHVKDGDGDVITGMEKFLGELIIFKRRSIHTLRGTSLDDFLMDELESSIGCVGPRAKARHGTAIYFVSDEGLCVFNGMRALNLSRAFIPKLWAKVNKAYIHKAVVGVWDGLIWFALPEGESTYNNLVIIFDPSGEQGRFWPWRQINISCMETFNDGNKVVLYAGDSRGEYVNQLYVGTEDFGKAIESYWVGKSFDLGMAEYEKKAKRAFVETSPHVENAPELQVALDYGEYNNLTLERQDDMIKQYRFSVTKRWRYLSPKLVHNEKGEFEVRGILIPFKAKAKPKVREVGTQDGGSEET